MPTGGSDANQPNQPNQPRRADARRNQTALVAAAATVFASRGVGAPIREIAAEAGVGVGTIYRHFPTRADLVIAVYRHQVDACAEAGPALLSEAPSATDALRRWIHRFADFLVTKHGLADVLNPADDRFAGLHGYFLDRLVPVCADLLAAAASAAEIDDDIGAYELMRGVGNLCIGGDTDDHYEPRRLIDTLLRGLERPAGG